jgi:hypothetical protein
MHRCRVNHLALMVALVCAPGVGAATHRYAVIVGHDRGADGQPVLQFAQDDAEKLAGVLTELGGVPANDLWLLRGVGVNSVRVALASVTDRVRGVHAADGDRAVVIFYFSGHSDGESLELGAERLTFTDLRAMLRNTAADVRVIVLDSCRSGALLALKGGQPAPAFQIRLTDEINSSGEALISSSAADEIALESREIRGSFFTHHFVSGLRGAADSSGDGLVTLAEAYDYAFAHTLRSTAATTVGPQHPTYAYRLSGQGDLVMTDLTSRSASLTLPGGLDRALVVDRKSARVLAETGPGGAHELALPAGEYLVRAALGKVDLAASVTLQKGERRTLASSELSPGNLELAQVKGSLEMENKSWSIAFGVSRGVAAGALVQPALRISREVGSWGYAAQIGSAEGPDFRESSMLVSVTRDFARIDRGALTAGAGLAAGAGAILQARRYEPTAWSPAASAGVQASFGVRLVHRIWLGVCGQFAAEVLRVDSKTTVRPLPSAFVGLSYGR